MPPDRRYIVALDQGTTSSRCVIFDMRGRAVSSAQREHAQIYPRPGWVEHDPMEIWACQYGTMIEAMGKIGARPGDIAGIGITDQRETSIVWDRHTGMPIHNAIVWQCRRTADICDELASDAPFAKMVRERTGLLIDAYFSATKIKWLLDTIPGARGRAEAGDLIFGTIDTWLIWRLTGGRSHVTDRTNASRTMLYDIKKLRWDEEICARLDIPMRMLPEVRESSGALGTAVIDGTEVPITGAAGDQQASLFGQCCFSAGSAKNTYGTGCFLLMNTGSEMRESANGMITTLAASSPEDRGRPQYAMEGSVFIGGAVVQWLRDELGMIRDAAESELAARRVDDTGGVYVVPAFTGLGAPYWDMRARGAIVGLSRGTSRDHIVRAALESIAYQSADVLAAMERDTGVELRELKVDGGASANDLLMQFQADIVGREITRPSCLETTAVGAAYLAGLGCGAWSGRGELRGLASSEDRFIPRMSGDRRRELMDGWHDAVARTMSARG